MHEVDEVISFTECYCKKYLSLATHLYHVVIINVRFKAFQTNETDEFSVVFTGVFTAPVAGVYYFTFFYQAGKNATNLQLFKNSQVIVRTSEEKTSYDTTDSGGNAVALQLEERDEVYVRMAANCEVWAGDHHTSFSGFLVSKNQ